jgi:hypothetical protein
MHTKVYRTRCGAYLVPLERPESDGGGGDGWGWAVVVAVVVLLALLWRFQR